MSMSAAQARRQAVAQALEEAVEEHGARPLSALTGGIHLHTVRCPDEKTFRRVRKSLEAENFLLNM